MTTENIDNNPAAEEAPRDLASILYGPKPTPPADDAAPEAIKAERAANPARSLYSPQQTFAKAIPDDLALDLDLDAHAAREVAADLGANADEVQQFLALPHAENQEQVDAWHDESVKAIRRGEVSKEDFVLAAQFVRRDPRLAEYLTHTGLGSNIAVIKQAVELARRARFR